MEIEAAEPELGLIAKTDVASIKRVPPDRVVAMLQSCATQIREVVTVDDARELADVADALAAMTNRLAKIVDRRGAQSDRRRISTPLQAVRDDR